MNFIDILLKKLKSQKPGQAMLAGLSDTAARGDMFGGLVEGHGEIQNPRGSGGPVGGALAGLFGGNGGSPVGLPGATPPIRPGDAGPGIMRGDVGRTPQQRDYTDLQKLIELWMSMGRLPR